MSRTQMTRTQTRTVSRVARYVPSSVRISQEEIAAIQARIRQSKASGVRARKVEIRGESLNAPIKGGVQSSLWAIVGTFLASATVFAAF